MTVITPDEQESRTDELLQSLQRSIRELRQNLEDLTKRVQAGEEADLQTGNKQVQAVEGLVRTCQKVEANLVEQRCRKIGIVQGGYALDLEKARFEVGCRLARLRGCGDPRNVPE